MPSSLPCLKQRRETKDCDDELGQREEKSTCLNRASFGIPNAFASSSRVIVSWQLFAVAASALKNACLLCAESWTGCLDLGRCLEVDLDEATNLLERREESTRAATMWKEDGNRVG